MSSDKIAAFLVGCLEHMPEQKDRIKAVVDTAIAGLKRIADGGDWPRNEALVVRVAARAADKTVAWIEDWAAARAAYWSADWAIDWTTAEAAFLAADWAARAHPDPDAERARQAKVREKLGL